MAGKDEIYLVDGSGFIFRAYYAMAYGRGEGGGMTNPDGVPVGAVFGFTNMMLKLLKERHVPYIAVIFDAARKNFRNDIYPDYKANRDETPEDLVPQFPLVREATEALGIPAIDMEGFEADDLIATYVRRAREKGKNVTIVSSDKDLMQLVGDGVRMLDPMKQQFIGPEDVLEKFGVPPEKVVDVQALAGDATDNIPGVPGIGLKTAAQLINEYGDLETLLARAGDIRQPKRREALLENAELARISLKLVTLDRHIEVPVCLNEMEAHDPDTPKLAAFLRAQGFKSILARLGENTDGIPAKAGIQSGSESTAPDPVLQRDVEEGLPDIRDNQYTLIDDLKTLKAWIDEAFDTGYLAIDTETTNLTPAMAKLVGISISPSIGRAAYIPLGHAPEEVDLLGEAAEELKQIPLEECLQALKPLLEDKAVLKIGQNIKYDWQMLFKHGIKMFPCDDTMLLSYCLDGTSHSNAMDELSKQFLDHTPIKYEEVAGKGKKQVTFDRVPVEAALDYAAEDAEITHRLYRVFKPRLAREKMAGVYEDIERPLIPVIAQMELSGIKVDPAILKSMSHEFGKKLADLESDIQKAAGTEFNVASPRQIGEILFEQMGLEGGKKTKTGQWSTDVGTLEKLALQGHDIVTKILEWRQLSKLKSTYTDALQEQINPETGRVHTSFSMAGTSTGRLASSDPNLQNIPIRSEEGRKIREAFVAEKGHLLLSVDYSQVELRLVAEMANVKALKAAFREGVDIHALTASQVFGVGLEDVTPDLRRQAKAVNFGIIYGISGWGLAKQLDCDPADANEFIKKYLNTFSEIRDYMEAVKEEARKHEFVRTLYGRKCFVPNINAKNGAWRAGAERAAINAPLQGTAADIMKKAMARMPAALEKEKLSAKMLLQVHDELIFEVPEEELDATAALVKSVMENVAVLDVPLIAEVGSARSWAQAH
ncbi:MAG: DNA polymerase I [Rhodospirillales bacterium]|nr:DNA polymerase I [Alphaproteobacteria bacterium]USO04576.1 MAG: DNA polymerase I [Rhodospirillales bacterium]